MTTIVACVLTGLSVGAVAIEGSSAAAASLTTEPPAGSTVVYTNGKFIPYLSEATAESVKSSKVFVGTQVVKNPDGTCVKTETTLVEMGSAKNGNAEIQLPTTSKVSTSVPCPN